MEITITHSLLETWYQPLFDRCNDDDIHSSNITSSLQGLNISAKMFAQWDCLRVMCLVFVMPMPLTVLTMITHRCHSVAQPQYQPTAYITGNNLLHSTCSPHDMLIELERGGRKLYQFTDYSFEYCTSTSQESQLLRLLLTSSIAANISFHRPSINALLENSPYLKSS